MSVSVSVCMCVCLYVCLLVSVNVTSAASVAVFRSRLKTHLFNISYPSPLWLYSASAVTLSYFGHFNRSCLLTNYSVEFLCCRVSLYVSLSVCVCLYVCVYVCLSVCMSVCLSVSFSEVIQLLSRIPLLPCLTVDSSANQTLLSWISAQVLVCLL